MSGRKAAFLLGHDAEFWAACWLRAKGYRILAQRFSAAGGEIDLIAWRFGTLAFVEVKARPRLEEALYALTPAKMARIGRAARVYVAHTPLVPRRMRLDAVVIAPNHFPRHIEDIAPLPL